MKSIVSEKQLSNDLVCDAISQKMIIQQDINTLLSEDELKAVVSQKLQKLLSLNNIAPTDLGRVINPKSPNSTVNTVRNIIEGLSLPSFFNFYKMTHAIPGLNANEIMMLKKRAYYKEEEPLIAAEPSSTYQVIKPWAQEKIELLERIKELGEDLSRAYRENYDLRQKLSDTQSELGTLKKA